MIRFRAWHGQPLRTDRTLLPEEWGAKHVLHATSRDHNPRTPKPPSHNPLFLVPHIGDRKINIGAQDPFRLIIRRALIKVNMGEPAIDGQPKPHITPALNGRPPLRHLKPQTRDTISHDAKR